MRGGERQLLYLASALRARGHRNVVVYRKGAPLGKEARRLGLETWHLPFLGEWDLSTALALRLGCGRSQGRILHAHTGHAAALARVAGALGGAPRVLHRRVDFALNGFLSRLKYGPARVIAVSNAIRSVLLADGLEPGKIEVVPDGIPINGEECQWIGVEAERFRPPSKEQKTCLRRELSEELNIPSEATWIGNLAALVPHKDHDTLIAAALIVILKRPDAVFLIAGEGPEGPRLLDSVKKMGLLGKVLLIGQRPDPVPLLKSLDIFALSSWGEGMGSVLLEASACGIPIAVTAAGGIPEILEDGRAGLLSPVRDPEALAANILRLMDDPALGRRLAEEAKSRLPRFGLGRMAEQMERIYERVTADAGA